MSEASSDVRRKKLRWRSWHRGTREMDLLISGLQMRTREAERRTARSLRATVQCLIPISIAGWSVARRRPLLLITTSST